VVIIWNFTDDGFTSVVEYSPPVTQWDKDLKKHVPFDDGIINNLPADYCPADNKTLSSHLLVRARIKEDLDALKAYDVDAVETENKLADYQYRLVIRRSAYAQYLYDKAMQLDYDSHVKETIDRRAPAIAGGRYGALSAIWSACARWQPNNPWGNTVNYGGYGQQSYYAGNNKTGTQTTKPYANEAYNPKEVWTNGSGGAAPKAILPSPSGSAKVRSDFADTTKPTLDEVLDRLEEGSGWVEPSSQLQLGETEEGLNVTAEATRASMIAQIKDFAQGKPCEVEALVDELINTWGTIDVDTIPNDILLDMMVEYESVSTILAGMP
jgi:hypothetical protein